MIYEIRTYDLKPRSVPEFERRVAEKLKEGRQTYSPLFGFWYTEAGPLNQVVHVWPYEDAKQRQDIRAKVVADGRVAAEPWRVHRPHARRRLPAGAVHARPRRRQAGTAVRNAHLHLRGRRHPARHREVERARPRTRKILAAGRRLVLGRGRPGTCGFICGRTPASRSGCGFAPKRARRAYGRRRGGIAPLRQESKLLTPFSCSPPAIIPSHPPSCRKGATS